MTFGSVFAGIGGFDLGLERAGMCCQWQIEIDAYAVRVLAKHWPGVKRYGDVRTVFGYDAESSRFFNVPAAVDLVCGGFPCQDVSTAGGGIGIIGTRSGLWSELARLVADLRPQFVLVENVPSLRGRGLALVLQDLWALGYDAEWHCIPASAFGANHERDRIWIIGYPAGKFREPIIATLVPDLNGAGCGAGWRRGRSGETHGAGTFVRTARPALLRSEEGNADAALAYADLPRLEEQERCDEKNSRPLSEVLPNHWSGQQSHGANAMLGPLNPAWCEWYMGFPTGWTELKRSATPLCRKLWNGSGEGSWNDAD